MLLSRCTPACTNCHNIIKVQQCAVFMLTRLSSCCFKPLSTSCALFLTARPSHLSQVSRRGQISQERQFRTALTAAWPLDPPLQLKAPDRRGAFTVAGQLRCRKHTPTRTAGTPSPSDPGQGRDYHRVCCECQKYVLTLQQKCIVLQYFENEQRPFCLS